METVPGMVQRACDPSASVRQSALEDLCRRYWKPAYYFLRAGWAKSNEDAKDLAQGFFLWLVEGGHLRRYEPERASFRTFLKALLRHFVKHQDEAAGRLKRGGGVKMLKLQDPVAPLEGVLADPRSADPDKAFHEAWRAELVVRAVDRVRERFLGDRQSMKFRVFEEYYLCPVKVRPTYAALATRLKIKEIVVKHALVDIREEVRGEIRKELAENASGREELEEEWNAFFGS